MVTGDYGRDRYHSIKTASITGAPPVGPRGFDPCLARGEQTRWFGIPRKVFILIGCGALGLLFFVLLVVFPVFGKLYRSGAQTVEYVDLMRAARSGEPGEKWSTLGHYFCRGARRSWFCADADEGEE